MSTHRVRISARVLGHLEGSNAWQNPTLDYNEAPEIDLMTAIKAAPARKDGSVIVELDATARTILYSYADVFAIGARDNVSAPGDPYGDPGTLADLNAARALMRQLNTIDRSL